MNEFCLCLFFIAICNVSSTLIQTKTSGDSGKSRQVSSPETTNSIEGVTISANTCVDSFCHSSGETNSTDQLSKDNNCKCIDENTTHEITVIKKENTLKEIYEKISFVNDFVIIPIVSPIGIVGNALVAYVLFKQKKSNSSFIYMVFILLADMVSLISDLFLPIGRLLQMSNSKQLLKVGVYAYHWNMTIISSCFRRFTLNIFCVLSYERLVAITRPLQLHQSATVTHSFFFIVVAFISSTVCSAVIPMCLKFVEIYDPVLNSTQYIQVYTDLYTINKEPMDIVMIVSRFFGGPLQIVYFTTVNILIIVGLHTAMKSTAVSENCNRSQHINKLQIKLCKIFLILSLTNMVAFLPSQITVILARLAPGLGISLRSYSLKLFLFGGHFLKILNSLTDFVVFLVMSKDIRKHVCSTLSFQWCKPKDCKKSVHLSRTAC
ncbi:unnamed protein product [Mytilus coruscus]|uniref:G-protein coupled receptors family 1 profile domain-containing protein n=1 Tax=Mytilus coruscus TaxID=42192 RepID=A0A6J8D5P0_MYTCO|nr:unnamed protein product [Mytilus coruscus]